MEVATIFSVILTSILVFERLWKYTISHLRKSSCCGGSVEFEHNENEK